MVFDPSTNQVCQLVTPLFLALFCPPHPLPHVLLPHVLLPPDGAAEAGPTTLSP